MDKNNPSKSTIRLRQQVLITAKARQVQKKVDMNQIKRVAISIVDITYCPSIILIINTNEVNPKAVPKAIPKNKNISGGMFKIQAIAATNRAK